VPDEMGAAGELKTTLAITTMDGARPIRIWGKVCSRSPQLIEFSFIFNRAYRILQGID